MLLSRLLLFAAWLGITSTSHAEVTPGEILVAEMNCTACHEAAPAISQRLASRVSPNLGRHRLSPPWIREFLANPQETKPGTLMPDMLHRVPPEKKAEIVDELTHYLAAIQPVEPAPSAEPTAEKINAGQRLYHAIGCVQCHAPFVAPLGRSLDASTQAELAKLQEHSVPLAGPKMASKYDLVELSRFLRDPLEFRPGGRMPSMKLSPSEAEAIASYLLHEPAGPVPKTVFTVDAAKANAGANHFISFQCAKCHTNTPQANFTISTVAPAAPALARMRPRQPIGCLSAVPKDHTAKFQLTDRQRTVLIAGLQNQAVLEVPLTANQQIKRTMTTLNCYACHSRDRRGGPSQIHREYVTPAGEIRWLDLTQVGARMKPSELQRVFEADAGVQLPGVTRMPEFGKANVGHLPEAFVSADHPAEKTKE